MFSLQDFLNYVNIFDGITKKIKTILTKPTQERINYSSELLKYREVVAMLTETAHGFTAGYSSLNAIKKIFEVNGRP